MLPSIESFNTFSELREGSAPVLTSNETSPTPGSPPLYGDFHFATSCMSVSSESDQTPRTVTDQKQMKWASRNGWTSPVPTPRKHSGPPSTKLVLTLGRTDLKEGYDGAFYAEIFLNFGFEVFVKGCARRNKLIIGFTSTTEANRALRMQDMIDYRLERYVDVKKSLFPPKASPRTPVFYVALHDLVLRSQRSVKSEQIGIIAQNSKVLVNTIRGRRARLVTRTECGEGTEDLGWVSLRTAGADRMTLLRPLRRTMDSDDSDPNENSVYSPSLLEESF